jgi:hypothetical protein
VSDYQSGWPAQPPADSPSTGSFSTGSGYGQERATQQAAAPRRRRKRWPWVVTIVVVVLLVAAGIGDQVARSYAEGRIAQQVQTSGHLTAKPNVTIEGWPFLTQALSRNFSTIDISANDVTANSGKLTFNFTAKATGVHVNSSFNSATVNHITGQALLPFGSVTSLLDVPSGTITLSADPADGPDAVKASSPLGSLKGTVKLASPSEIAITLDQGSGFASLFSGLSGNAFTIDIPALPAGLVVQSVSVTSQGIVANASANNTTLS